jgi:hypothetical protein
MLEPYAVKVASTVLRGGKPERAYLSQLDTLVVHTLNDGGYRLGPLLLLRHNSLVSESWSAALAAQGPGVWSHPRSEGIKLPAWGV